MSGERKPTEAQRRRLLRRAHTIAYKSAELFNIAEAIFGEDDREWLPFFGETMCSADELRNMIEAPIEGPDEDPHND